MGQRLALVLACMMAMCVPVRGDQKKSSNLVSSALEFFESHTDVSIDGFLGRLRPPPIDAIEHDRIVAALPPHGAIRPDAHALAKMRLAEHVLAYHGRLGVISFTIIDVLPAFVGLHARAVILVSPPALALVSDEEFAALVAHEIGHEYVWLEYEAAEQRADHARIRELELRCDGIAVLTLRRLGVDAERLVRAVEMLTWYNEQRRLDADRSDYVSREDRKAFIRAIAKLPWGVTRPTTTEHPGIITPNVTTLVPSSSPAQSPTVDERTARERHEPAQRPSTTQTKQSPSKRRENSVIDCGASTRSGFWFRELRSNDPSGPRPGDGGCRTSGRGCTTACTTQSEPRGCAA